jgi:hypothetical protein
VTPHRQAQRIAGREIRPYLRAGYRPRFANAAGGVRLFGSALTCRGCFSGLDSGGAALILWAIMLRPRVRRQRLLPPRFDVPLAARNRALHYLANESRLTDELLQQLTEVVHGYVGPCDPVAARKGIDWMRRRYRDLGQTPRF